MKIHEYQAKEFFARYGIPVDEHVLCQSPEEAVEAYRKIGSEAVVVKAQVHTGGRGKAGGVKVARDEEEVRECAQAILGMDIKGFKVGKILVSRAANIAAEYYVSVVVDRTTKSAVLMMSRSGGMDIEEVAKTAPEKIIKMPIDPLTGLRDFQARDAAYALFDEKNQVKQAVPLLKNLYRMFVETDASLAEINPLICTKEGGLMAVDAKMTFDDNALFRQPDAMRMFEPTEEEQIEYNAKQQGFSYVNLGGNIGCMVNGAGLAMATMDMIKLYGGNPANFLDIGGSSNPQKVIDAMKLLMSDKHVNLVLVNIFGGITRGDDVARGLVEAFNEIDISMPVVIRLTGTNAEEGRKILEGTKFHVATTMAEAGKMAVELSDELK